MECIMVGKVMVDNDYKIVVLHNDCTDEAWEIKKAKAKQHMPCHEAIRCVFKDVIENNHLTEKMRYERILRIQDMMKKYPHLDYDINDNLVHHVSIVISIDTETKEQLALFLLENT